MDLNKVKLPAIVRVGSGQFYVLEWRSGDAYDAYYIKRYGHWVRLNRYGKPNWTKLPEIHQQYTVKQILREAK